MATAEANLSYCAREVRRSDSDRFLTCLLAPEDRREALFALHAFNLEIAKTREVVTEPLIGRMRLQWWRDAIANTYGKDGGVEGRSHAVLAPLGQAVVRHRLSRRHLDTLIDAREADLEPTGPATMACLVNYAEVTAVPLVLLGLEVLDVRDRPAEAAARHAGIAFALTGLLRAVPFHRGQRRLYLPADRLAAHGVRVSQFFDFRRPDPGIPAVVREVAETAREHLNHARALQPMVSRAGRSILRVATLADLYLRRFARLDHDPFHPLASAPHPWRAPALLWARLSGRI